MTPTRDNQPPDKPSRRACPERSRRGGYRPGSGGKPGNLNALKHGRRSAQLAQLGLLLAAIPETHQALLHLARRHHLKQRKAEQVAARLLNAMMERAHQIAERRTINGNDGDTADPQIPDAPS
jgi:hypothetical protein